MPVNYRPIQRPEQKGFKIDVYDDQLVITIEKDFDAQNRRSSWAADIVDHYFGPFNEVVVDLGKVSTITSTVIAGLVHFNDFYWKQCPEGFCLANVHERILKVLEMMKLRALFPVKQDWTHKPAIQRSHLDVIGDEPEWLG